MFNTNVLEQLLSVFEHFGSRSAFFINETSYSYFELAERVSSIRSCIRSMEIKTPNIGIITNDDIETYSSILAIWLEGMAYVPINPSQPYERNIDIINQADICLVLDSSLVKTFADIDTIMTRSLGRVEINLVPVNANDSASAYIMFTSGSTGKPKGVQITRGNISSFVDAFWGLGYKIDENDRCLQPFDLSFDLSVMSYLIPLLKGSCVFTVPGSQIKYSMIAQILEDHSLTVALMVPSVIRYLRPYFNEIDLPAMRYSMFCGEALPVDLAKEWSRCVPNAYIDNVYGPTEDTIFCSQYRYSRSVPNKSHNGILSIGKSMTSGRMIIVNDNNLEVPAGEHGELCLAGLQLTPGYWKNPLKNKESFFVGETGTRFYKTGDLCYKDGEGDIMYVGRIDNQIKMQGYRIELGEIEHYADDFLAGINPVAIAFENKDGNTEIALFLESDSADTAGLMSFLKLKLPSYMLPSRILLISKLPLNINGKIDRKELRRKISETNGRV